MKFFTIVLSICFLQVKFQSKILYFFQRKISNYKINFIFIQISSSFGNPNKTVLEIPDINHYLTSGDATKNVSQQFIEDVNIIHEKFPNNRFVTVSIVGMVSAKKILSKVQNQSSEIVIKIQKFQLELLANTFHGKDSKIDLARIKNFPKSVDEHYWIIDGAQILNTILSKELPPERTNGILNLWLSLRATATDAEIGNALVSSGGEGVDGQLAIFLYQFSNFKYFRDTYTVLKHTQ